MNRFTHPHTGNRRYFFCALRQRKELTHEKFVELQVLNNIWL
jgi:hypothetical protein